MSESLREITRKQAVRLRIDRAAKEALYVDSNQMDKADFYSLYWDMVVEMAHASEEMGGITAEEFTSIYNNIVCDNMLTRHQSEHLADCIHSFSQKIVNEYEVCVNVEILDNIMTGVAEKIAGTLVEIGLLKDDEDDYDEDIPTYSEFMDRYHGIGDVP